jgi:hypothetical protein
LISSTIYILLVVYPSLIAPPKMMALDFDKFSIVKWLLGGITSPIIVGVDHLPIKHLLYIVCMRHRVRLENYNV